MDSTKKVLRFNTQPFFYETNPKCFQDSVLSCTLSSTLSSSTNLSLQSSVVNHYRHRHCSMLSEIQCYQRQRQTPISPPTADSTHADATKPQGVFMIQLYDHISSASDIPQKQHVSDSYLRKLFQEM